MLKWNKEKERYETTKNQKFSRHDMMDKDAEVMYRCMAGVAFFILRVAVSMFVQSC